MTAKVRHTPTANKTPLQVLTILDNACNTGGQCAMVAASPLAAAALGVLQGATATAHASFTRKLALAQALMAAMAEVDADTQTARIALTSYEHTVGCIPGLDAAIISLAGLQEQAPKGPPAALGNVIGLFSKPGKHPGESILGWPKVSGATGGFAIEVSFAPLSAAATWVALPSGTRRRRVVKGPGPASQILVRVAALGADGTQSDWSDPLLVTTA